MLRIDGKTTLMGLLGKNISYTLSPVIHNAAIAHFGLNSVYLAYSLEPEKIQAFLDLAWQLGAVGFNVTKPHKELVAKLFPKSGLSSVNTLKRGSQTWEAYSTDGEGFGRGVERMGQPLKAYRNFVVLGDGGASQAILSYLVDRMAEWGTSAYQSYFITVLSRKCDSIIRDNTFFAALNTQSKEGSCPFRLSFKPFQPHFLEETLMQNTDQTLLIQGTSAPQQGDMLDPFVPSIKYLKGAVVDILYDNPSNIYFGAMAKDIVAQDGEAMLIEQARLSQELWWGKSLTYEAIRRELKPARLP
jgi:shikimate dehydrogenase